MSRVWKMAQSVKQLPYNNEDAISIPRTYFNKMDVRWTPLNPVLGKQRKEDPGNSLSVVYLNQWAPGLMTDYDGMECTWETRHLTHTLFIHVPPSLFRHLSIYSVACLIQYIWSGPRIWIPTSFICCSCYRTRIRLQKLPCIHSWAYICKETSVQQSFKVSTLWIKFFMKIMGIESINHFLMQWHLRFSIPEKKRAVYSEWSFTNM